MRERSRKKSRLINQRNSFTLHESQKNIGRITYSPRAGSSTKSSRWRTWTILWFAKNFWVWLRTTLVQLLVSWWLCWSRKIIGWDYLSFVCIQNKISWKFFFTKRKPRMLYNQQDLWVLRRVQKKIQCLNLERIFLVLWLSTHSSINWR